MLFYGMVKLLYKKKAIITHHILMKMIKNGEIEYMEYGYINKFEQETIINSTKFCPKCFHQILTWKYHLWVLLG